MYKFSRDVIFADEQNPGFLQFFRELFIKLISTLHMHCDRFKNFEDLIFVDDKLSAIQRKLRPLKICMYICGILVIYLEVCNYLDKCVY